MKKLEFFGGLVTGKELGLGKWYLDCHDPNSWYHDRMVDVSVLKRVAVRDATAQILQQEPEVSEDMLKLLVSAYSLDFSKWLSSEN